MERNSPPSPQDRGSFPGGWYVVKASAGSGKTHLLVNRLLRLYLSGSGPQDLMALTFTIKAANEMKERLLHQGRAMLSGLNEDMASQLHVDPEAPACRAFFWDALDHFSRIHLSTIHSFCHRVVSGFPLECGLPWQVRVLDPVETQDITASALDGFLLEISEADPNSALAMSASELLRDSAGTHNLKMWLAGSLDKANLVRMWLRQLGCAGESLDPLLTSDPEPLFQAMATDFATGFLSQGDSFAKLNQELPQLLNALQNLAGILETARRSPKNAVAMAQNIRDVAQSGTPGLEALRQLAVTLETGILGDKLKAKWQAQLVETPEFAEARKAWLPLLRREAAQRFLARMGVLVHFLCRYEVEKSRRGAIDFSDMEWFALSLLSNPDPGWSDFVLLMLSQKLRHLAMDEFQDTSLSQWNVMQPLVQLLTGADTGEPGTVFCVGDVKQSIYRFRNAEPELMHVASGILKSGAAQAGKDFANLNLPYCYRSVPAVLSFVDQVFQSGKGKGMRLPEGEDTSVLPRRTGASSYGRVRVEPLVVAVDDDGPDEGASGETSSLSLPTPAQRRDDLSNRDSRSLPAVAASWLADTVESLVAQEPVWDKEAGGYRRARYEDILVLIKARTYAQHFEDEFKRRSIPYVTSGKATMDSRTEYQDTRSLLRFASNPRSDMALVEVLRGPLFRLSDKDLQSLTRLRPRKHRTQGGRAEPLWKTLHRLQADLALPLPLRQALPDLQHIASHWRKPASELFLTLQERYSLVDRYEQLYNPGKAANLRQFWSLALAAEGNGNTTLQRFLRLLEKMAGSQELTDAPLPAGTGGGAVRFMTIHASKGLEAPIIILPDAGRTPPEKSTELLVHRDPETREIRQLFPRLGAAYPIRQVDGVQTPSDPYLAAVAEELRRGEEEEGSLAYVALTRARDQLIVGGFSSSKNLKAYEDTLHAACTRAMIDWEPQLGLHIERPALDEGQSLQERWTVPYQLESGVPPQKLVETEAQVLPPQPRGQILEEGSSVLWRIRHPSNKEAGADREQPLPGTTTAPPLSLEELPGQDAQVFPVHGEQPTSDRSSSPPARSAAEWGLAIHNLLEWAVLELSRQPVGAPGSSLDRATMRRIAANHVDPENVEAAVETVLSLLDKPSLSWIFRTPGAVEQSVFWEESPGALVFGIVDRWVESGSDVVVIDYKSNLHPEHVDTKVKTAYGKQVQLYMEALRAHWPDRSVYGCLLWTANQEVDWVSDPWFPTSAA